jgi:predicted enzyme related to lactoylglutathione lyase
MIKRDNANAGFDFGGINHLAIVCADMAKTVDFYSGVLGMPLVTASHSNSTVGQRNLPSAMW